jgi:hypothetical protein
LISRFSCARPSREYCAKALIAACPYRRHDSDLSSAIGEPTMIIAVSIPLSILVSVILLLSALGETINIMTLGGLALAVGILVDDATVEIENIERNLAHG